MISEITPASYTICPNCILKGYHWHPNGNWYWSSGNPHKMKCNVCGMEFPNDEYPETISYKSWWDPNQEFTYVNIPGQLCIGYKGCRPAINGVLRKYKLQFMIGSCLPLAYSYQLTGNISYANCLKRVFTRMAKVFPRYLVYQGYSYNEYTDCDPHYVSMNLLQLNVDPSKNCRLISAEGYKDNPKKVYANYASASRVGTNGMDGLNVINLAIAYDLIRETLTSSEQASFEKNIIEELCWLFLGDDTINNKAVANRLGAGYAGLSINSSTLAIFGLDGFVRTINEWWLPDGGTSESPAYGFMTLDGIYKFGYAFRNFTSPDGNYTNFNVNTDTRFDQVFQDLIWTSLGNYYYPPLADSYTYTTFSSDYAEFMNFAYPNEKEFIAHKLRPIKQPNNYAIFFRDPDQVNFTEEEYTHPDIVFPYLAQAYLRTGDHGEKSAVIVDASNWGSHHHRDSLNLVYWKDGRELLNDLGYLWDHPNLSQTRPTDRHNTVFIDKDSQIDSGRNGSISIFAVLPNIKVIQAASDAYLQCDIYNRTVVQIEHNDKSSYLVDIFRVRGGEKRQYVFHGPNNNYTLKSDLQFTEQDDREYVHFHIRYHIGSLGYIQVRNAVLYEDDKKTEMLTQPPEKPDGWENCQDTGTWCTYVGDGSRTVSSTGGVITFTGLANSAGKVNVALNVGNTYGYTGPDSLVGAIGAKYTLAWEMRGTVQPTMRLVYWDNDRVNESSAKVTQSANIDALNPTINEEKWQKYNVTFYLVKKIPDFKYGYTQKSWDVVWEIDENYTFQAKMPYKKDQKVYYMDGWGQRDYKNTDYGATLPYFYIDDSSDPENFSTFVAVYEGHYSNESSTVKSVSFSEKGRGNVGVEIDTKDGKDYVFVTMKNDEIKINGKRTDASVAVETCEGSKYMIGGTFYENRKNWVREWNGKTLSYHNSKENSWFVIQSKMSRSDWKGQSLHVKGDDGIERAYPVFHVETESLHKQKIYTRYKSRGFRLDENVEWRVQSITDLRNPFAGEVLGYVAIGCVGTFLISYAVFILIMKFKKGNKNQSTINATLADC